MERITAKLRRLAGQENCDGSPYDEMMEAAEEIDRLNAELAAIRALMNCYNIGGWTDAIEPMKRAETAEAELAEKEKRISQKAFMTMDEAIWDTFVDRLNIVKTKKENADPNARLLPIEEVWKK